MSTKIRVEKAKNFTILSNKLLQDKRLSFKAKGLLAFMLSLPPDWDYSIEGLAYCAKDGKNSIRTALNELKECGYLVMERARDDKGRLDGTEYIMYFVKQNSAKLASEIPDVGAGISLVLAGFWNGVLPNGHLAA